MAKVRVYELAKELDKDNKSLEEVIRGLGIPIKNYMSTLTPDEAERVRAAMGGSKSGRKRDDGKKDDGKPAAKSGPAKRRGPGVIRRRGAEVRKRRAEREAEEAAEAAAREDAPPAPRTAPTTRPVVRPSTAGRARPAAPPLRPSAPSSTAAPQASAGAAVSSPASGTAAPSESPVRKAEPVGSAQPTPSPRATEAPAPVPAPSRPEPSSETRPVAEPARQTPSASEETPPSTRPKTSPPVGSRIELPKGSRRLPGGLASRMPKGEAPREAEPAPSRAPTAQPPAAERRSAPTGAEVVAAASTDEGPGGERRVVRNEAGVIVGAAKQRSEPKILGFIPLAQTRKKQQVIITDASDEDRRGRASQRKQREERAQAQGRRRKMRKSGRGMGGPSKVSTVEMSEEKKRIRVDEAIQVSDLAHQMGQKATNVLRTLWGMGMRGITINHAIDLETAELVAAEFGYTVDNVAFQEDELLESIGEIAGEGRAPVVTVMGHVDHGKTSLLDHIRASRVAAGEAGGITQHIGAYKVTTDRGEVVFLDTPGHEAFTAMRERGTQITDIVVLVVAADDGVMPTTIEAIKHARQARVPIVVAVNKIDKPEANPGRVKQALMEQEIVGEEFGGNTPIVEVSAKTGQGIDDLLETLVLQAEVLELKAPKEGRAKGIVLEARIDKGRGTVATVLVQSGTLKKGDIVVANEYQGKVRSLFDQNGKPLKEAGPSTPVEVLGLSGVPQAGDNVNSVDSDRDAKALVAHRREQRKRKESVRSVPNIQELLSRKKIPVLKIVLKADVQGSAQALAHALEELSTEKVKVEVLKAEVGQINETDVKFARAGDAVIFGFNVKTTGKAAPVADAEQVEILTFGVIYEATDKCKELMVGLLEPEYRQKEQGEAEVRALFPIPRLGVVAGCRVTRGLIQRHSHVRVVRDGDVIHDGTISSLRIHKDDVREVKDGFECGIVVEGFPGVQEGDTIQAYEVEAIPPTL